MLWSFFVASLLATVFSGERGTRKSESDLACVLSTIDESSSDDSVSMLQTSIRMQKDGHLIGQKRQTDPSETKVAFPAFHSAVPTNEGMDSGSGASKTFADDKNLTKVTLTEEKGRKHKATAANQERKHFRAVSVTLRCVLALTFLFLATHTALAVARNVDELSGRVRPSLSTETLTVAARSTTLAPMFAALIFACRMYVLQSTGGLGEPQAWAKACMIAATAGLCMEPLIVCTLPLLVKHDKEPFTKLSGVACTLDIHPQLFRYGETYDNAFKYAWMAQMVALPPVYGGVGGVILAIFMYPAERTVSPSVTVTVILAAWYFCIHGILLIARTRHQIFPQLESESLPPQSINSSSSTTTLADVEIGDVDKFVKFSLNASYPMDTAPMFAVLFLAAKQRAAHMGTEPQVWAQVCFIACGVALPLLSMLNGIAGMNGHDRLGYYGERLYDADDKRLMIGKHVTAGILFTSMLLVVLSIFTLDAASDMATPHFSTTLESVLQISCQFFLVHALHWLFAANRAFVFKADRTLVIESSLVAARTSVQFCPILAILFVSCRMRALQMNGEPQGWAQDAMRVILGATTVQIVCCLALPIFTGMAAKTDAEGNAEYDLKPLIGAYMVTCMKYFALFLIFGGVAVVGSSMFSITPETARSDNVLFSGFVGMIGFLFLGMLVLMIVMVLSSAKVVGLAVKMAIESVDRTLLGVDVDVGAARLSICRGYVNLANVVVQNPEGYKTPYIMSVNKIVVKLDMMKLVKSRGNLVEIEALILRNVDIIFEKGVYSSNVQDLLKHLEGNKKPKIESEKEGIEAEKALGQMKKEEIVAEKEHQKVGDDGKSKQTMEVIVHQIEILDVGAKLASTYLGGGGVRVELGNIDYKDFQEQYAGRMEVNEVIRIILETLMKTAMVNTKIVGETVRKAAAKVEEVAHKAEETIASGVHKAEQTIAAGVQKIGDKAKRLARGVLSPFSDSPRGKASDS